MNHHERLNHKPRLNSEDILRFLQEICFGFIQTPYPQQLVCGEFPISNIYSIIAGMKKLVAFVSNYIILWLRLLSPGGAPAIVAANIMLRHQLITLSRGKKRAPRLTFFDKIT